MRPALTVPTQAARLFAIRALGLDTPLPSVGAALDHLGYVQIDPLNICGRMHDLILRNRVTGYREGDLMRHVHPPGDNGAGNAAGNRPRTAFEHHHPDTNILVAFPVAAWPHLIEAMKGRARQANGWSGRLTPTERKLVPEILRQIRERGPLASDEFGVSRRSRTAVWGAATQVKTTLQKLFFHGDLVIAERTKHRRRYDLPERVIPPEVLPLRAPSREETARWVASLKLRQRRLAALKREELARIDDLVTAVNVPDCPALHVLTTDLPLLESCVAEASRGADSAQSGPALVRLLAPLDPLIYDRRVTSALWQFDYTWEAYTPAAKRVRGHYALPVLSGLELTGHVEPKADRAAGRLIVASRSVRRGVRTAEALAQLAAWLGLGRRLRAKEETPDRS